MGRIFRYIKPFFKGLLLFSLFFVIFIFLLLPTSDLGHVISSQVSKNSRGQVNFQFEDMSFIPLPSIHSSFDNVVLEVKGLPALKADTLSVSASPFGLASLGLSLPSAKKQDDMVKSIAQNLAMSVASEGLFRGSVQLELEPGSKKKDGNPLHGVSIEAKKISLPSILKAFQVNFPLRGGELEASSQMQVDYLFAQQPEGKLKLSLQKLLIPSEQVETPAGPLVLPEVRVSQMTANGDVKDGIIRFSQIQLGRGQDNLQGTINGTLAMRINKRGNRVQPVFGAYDLNIDLSMSEELHQEAELLFLLVSKYKSEDNGRIRYAFRIQGSSFQTNPRYSAIRE